MSNPSQPVRRSPVTMKRLLALDPATHCGWAYRSASGSISSGVWDLSPKRDESKGMRLIRMEVKLNEMFRLGIDLLTFEAARYAGPVQGGAVVVQSEIQGIIKRFCEVNRIQYAGESSTDIKKFATGKGVANKDIMIAAARERLGYTGQDDNEADALWLLQLTISRYTG